VFFLVLSFLLVLLLLFVLSFSLCPVVFLLGRRWVLGVKFAPLEELFLFCEGFLEFVELTRSL
jgi:hypothetical protein